jgi:hypothetical protein
LPRKTLCAIDADIISAVAARAAKRGIAALVTAHVNIIFGIAVWRAKEAESAAA